MFHATLRTEWDVLQVVKLWVLFGFLTKPCPCFRKHSSAVHPFVLFCCPTAASPSHNIIPQAQTRTVPGNQREPLKMKQLPINKDSMTLEDLGNLAEGISASSWLPDYLWWHPAQRDNLQVVDKDGSPWGRSSAEGEEPLSTLRREHEADPHMWWRVLLGGCLEGNMSPRSWSEGSLWKGH